MKREDIEEKLDGKEIETEGLGDQFNDHPYKIRSFMYFFGAFVTLLLTNFSPIFYIPTVLGVLVSFYYSRQVEWDDEETEGGQESDE